MPRRFSRLKHAVKTLRTPANFNNPSSAVPAAPAGTVLEKFQQTLANQNFGNITRTPASLPGEKQTVIIQPFNWTNDAANKTIVPISARSKGKIAGTLTAAVLNHLADGGSRRARFQPAKAIMNNLTQGNISSPSSADPTSKITGVKYKYKGSGSYTFPFGQGGTDAEKVPNGVKNKIIAKAAELAGLQTINFKPEKA